MLDDTIHRLHTLNYSEIIRLNHPSPGDYSFNEYRERNYRHPVALAYCTACEDAGIHTATDESAFALGNISHGAHSIDFLQSCEAFIDTTGWHSAGVLFLFESPSINGGTYTPVTYKGYGKSPAHEWYWVHNNHNARRYPDAFKGLSYGELVRSTILTFRLANAYATNLVKCGLNNSTGDKFRPLAAFQRKCIETCYNRILSREIELIQPHVIFAFGTAVHETICALAPDQNIRVQRLPHPARRRSGFTDEYYETLYLWLIARALAAEGIVSKEQLDECVSLFIANAPERKAGIKKRGGMSRPFRK